MAFHIATSDPRTLDLMACVLETAWTNANLRAPRLSEDWQVMGQAVWQAVVRGERDAERLQRRAIDVLDMRRRERVRETVASAINSDRVHPMLGRIRIVRSRDANTPLWA